MFSYFIINFYFIYDIIILLYNYINDIIGKVNYLIGIL